jgi:hypothetical protein
MEGGGGFEHCKIFFFGTRLTYPQVQIWQTHTFGITLNYWWVSNNQWIWILTTMIEEKKVTTTTIQHTHSFFFSLLSNKYTSKKQSEEIEKYSWKQNNAFSCYVRDRFSMGKCILFMQQSRQRTVEMTNVKMILIFFSYVLFETIDSNYKINIFTKLFVAWQWTLEND